MRIADLIVARSCASHGAAFADGAATAWQQSAWSAREFGDV
jgi:hypothetical protein